MPVTELNYKFVRDNETDPYGLEPCAATVWGDSWAYADARLYDYGEYWETVGRLWLLPTGQGEGTPIHSWYWPMAWSEGAPIRCPDMAGGTIVWSEKRDADYDIYGYDMESETLFPICTATGDQTTPRVSGDLVVWADNRDGSTGWDIYGFDLNAGAEFPICSLVSEQTAPDVSGTTVVWVDTRNGDEDVYGATVDLAGQAARGFAVCTQTAAQTQPGIAGTQVVWTDARDGEGHIYGKDLEGGAVQRLSSASGEQQEPIISEGTVLWFQSDVTYSDDYRIVGLNLGTGEGFTTDIGRSHPRTTIPVRRRRPPIHVGSRRTVGSNYLSVRVRLAIVGHDRRWRARGSSRPCCRSRCARRQRGTWSPDMRFSYDSVHWTSFRPYSADGKLRAAARGRVCGASSPSSGATTGE